MKLIMSDRPISLEIGENKDIKYIDLSSMKIANCVGCFGCWTKTPVKCVIRDDATKVYPYIAECSSVIYVSHIKYGGSDKVVKKINDRAVPQHRTVIILQQGETHPLQANEGPKEAKINTYLDTYNERNEKYRQQLGHNA